MSCCGKMRQEFMGGMNTAVAKPNRVATERTERQFVIVLEYIGDTSLTAIGSMTGRRYHFAGPGSRIVIDPRDRPGLVRVPKLRQVT